MLISDAYSVSGIRFSCSKSPVLKLVKVLNFSGLSKLVRMKKSSTQRFVSPAVYLTYIRP